MSAIEYAGYALAVNFSILIVPGQIFFLIIQEAERSREDAMLAALGVALAEVVLLLLLFMGFTIYLRQLIPLLRWVGAILLFTLGVFGYLIFAIALLGSSLAVVFILVMVVSAGRNALGHRGLRILSLISGMAFIALGFSLIHPMLTIPQ
jgi:threonine/homoserine/homoserine lactone efflux protein